MKISIDKTLKIVIPVLVVLAILIALVLPWQCANAQGVAGSFTMVFDYSAGIDAAMQEQHGLTWQADYIKPLFREAWKNYRSTAMEAYKAKRASLFDESIDPALLLKSEANTLQRIADSVEARRERKLQREADSIAAAAQTQGSLIIEKDGYRAVVSDPDLIGLNIGRAFSPRLDFLVDGHVSARQLKQRIRRSPHEPH